MRKLFLVFVMVMAAAAMWAAPITLTFLSAGDVKFANGEDFRGYSGYSDKIAGDFMAKHPGVKVNIVYRDIKNGSMTADAMMAAGTPPDVWFDASGYFVKYMNADYALPMQKYGDVSVYFKNLLDLYTFSGNVYGIPVSNVAGGFAINRDMLKDIGYTMPDQPGWTTDEFLSLGAKLKAKNYPLTAIQAKGGLNSWTDVFLYSFGAAFYKNGDLSKTTINSPQAVAGLNYIKKIVDSGYAYGHPLEVNDDDAVEAFTTNQVFSSMMQNGHTDYWIPEQLKQGKISKVIDVIFVEAPHAPGIAHTPVYGYQSIVVAHKSKDEARNKLVAEFTFKIAGKEFEWGLITRAGGFPTIKDWSPDIGTAASVTYQSIAKLAPIAGLQEVGPKGDKGNEVTRIWNTLSEQFMLGKLTAQDFLSQYETQANAVLK